MDSRIKYFLHGAAGLIFSQVIGFFGFFLMIIFLNLFKVNDTIPSDIMSVLSVTLTWGIFGIYTGLLWNKELELGASGIVSGILVGIVGYSGIVPLNLNPFMIFLPGIILAVLLMARAASEKKINKATMFLYIGIVLAAILISVFQQFAIVLENKYTGILTSLIGFFSNLFSLIILGGLISSGYYYIYGAGDTGKNGFKRTFMRAGKIISVISILLMFVLALTNSQYAGYNISKVNEPGFFVVMNTEEINRFPIFAEAVKGNGYHGQPVPMEEWNALRDLLVEQKKCNSNGNCYVKINDSYYQINFVTS
jgi:hypothetical protein